MKWLTPLGLLGLLGLVVLIILYIIKPNYQKRLVSSTYIWKKSLKYRKKKIPVSKIRNILVFICQVLIITASACILVQPHIFEEKEPVVGETVLIIDVSASMHAQSNGLSRISRAVDAALADANEALEDGRSVSVILASDPASFLVRQAQKTQSHLIYDSLDVLAQSPETVFTYGNADLSGAMALAEQITSQNEDTTVTFYTDTTYLNPGRVTVRNVCDDSDWNAAILDVRAVLVENFYRIEIDVVSYGAEARFRVDCDIVNVNETGGTQKIEQDVYCAGDEVHTVVLGYLSEDALEAGMDPVDQEIAVYSYEHICVRISANDALDYDNLFYLYGGLKPTLRIQYYSSLYNHFWPSMLMVVEDIFRDSWDVEIVEVQENPAIEGFDLYIFEETIPKTLPTDGVVMLINPTSLPDEAEISLGQIVSVDDAVYFSPGNSNHPLMHNINTSRISVTRYTAIENFNGYATLAEYQGNPMFLLKETSKQKILVMPFSMNYSNFAVIPDFPLLLMNTIDHFFPVTTDAYVFDANAVVALNARSKKLEVTGPDMKLSLQEFPSDIRLSGIGTYTLKQTPISGRMIAESIFVKIPAVESQIHREEATLQNPLFYEEPEKTDVDLLFYLALAVVVLLFLERWLKSREQI